MTRPQRFRLERVLEHRRRLTEEAQVQLALRARARDAAETLLQRMTTEQSRAAEFLQQCQRHGPIDMRALLAAERYTQQLSVQATELRQVVAEAQQRENEALNDLLERQSQQRALEKLRDRQADAAAARARQIEEQLFDEITTTRYAARLRRPDTAPA